MQPGAPAAAAAAGLGGGGPGGEGGGEAEPLLGGRRRAKRNAIDRQKRLLAEAALAMLAPWAAFLLVSMLVMLLSHPQPQLPLASAIVCSALCVIGAVVMYQRVEFQLAYVALLCSFAVVMGMVAGFYNYCAHARDYWTFFERRQYANVWPSEPAAAHRDASVIVFADGAKPDAELQASFHTAHGTYCVAPIVMGSGKAAAAANDVQYWAAGIDCCGVGGFACDDVLTPGTRAGLVLYNRTSPFSSFEPPEMDYYMQAVAIAAAKFELRSAERPLFLRWVRDAEVALAVYLRDAWMVWLKVGVATLPVWWVLALGTPGLYWGVKAGGQAKLPQ